MDETDGIKQWKCMLITKFDMEADVKGLWESVGD